MKRRRTDLIIAWGLTAVLMVITIGIFREYAIPHQSLSWTAAGGFAAVCALLAIAAAIMLSVPWSDGDGG